MNNHTGNSYVEITREEHDGDLNAKRVVSAATIYAVVNTSAPGVGNSIVTVANVPLPVSFGNATLSDSKGFIGLTTVTGGALDIRSLNSTATLYAVVNTAAAAGGATGFLTMNTGDWGS